MDLLLKKIIVFFFDLKRKIILRNKISDIYRHLQVKVKISVDNLEKHKSLWMNLGSKPDLRWYKVYAAISRIDDPRYITEFDYYSKIEPTLNNRSFSEAFCDKNLYHKYIDIDLLPEVFLRNIHNHYYTENYEQINIIEDIEKYIPLQQEKIILKKAIDSGGGRGVFLFIKNGNTWQDQNGHILTKEFLKMTLGKNFVIQKYIQQHPFFSQFNSSSVNTIRLFTYRSVRTNEIIPLQAVLRIGTHGSYVDNMASGGIACGLNAKGILNKFGVNKKAEKIFSYNGIEFEQVGPVYCYDKIVATGLKLAKIFYYHRLLGFDFCVDNLGAVKLIEVNNRNNEINFFQMNNGPLFREYTEEIIDYCKENPRNFLIDFEYK